MLDPKTRTLVALFVLLLLAFAGTALEAKQRPYGGGVGIDSYKADGTERTRFNDSRFVLGFALVNNQRPTMAGCAGVVMGDEDDKIKAKKFQVNAGLQVNSSVRKEFPRQRVDYARQHEIEDQLGLVIPNFNYQIHAAWAPLDRTRSGETIDDLINSFNSGGFFFDGIIDNKMTLRDGNKYAGGCKLGSFHHEADLSPQAAQELFQRELIYDLLQQIIPGFTRPEQDEGPRER